MSIFRNSAEKNGVSLSRLSMRKRSIILFSISVVFLVSVFCCLILRAITMNVQYFYKDASEFAVRYSADFLQKRFDDFFNDLERVASSPIFEETDDREINARLAELDEIDKAYVLDFCFANADGLVRSKGGRGIDIKKSRFFQDFLAQNKRFAVSKQEENEFSKQESLFVARSVRWRGQDGILFYVIDMMALRNPVNRLAFAENASGFLIDQDGGFLMEPEFESVIKTKPGDAESLAQKDRTALFNFDEALRESDSGSVILDTIVLGKEFVSFAKIKNINWTVGMVEVMSSSYKHFFQSSLKLVSLFALFAILVILLYAFITLSGTRGKSSHRLTLQQDSDFDELTGLWTESRFEEECERLLKENPDKNYMLFGIDIRGFRIVQQTEGVAAANEQLMTLAKRLGQIALQQNGIAARGAIDHLYMMYPIGQKTKEEALAEYESFLYNGNYFPGRAGERLPTKTGIVFAGKDYEKDGVQSLIGKSSYAKHIIQDNLLQNYSVYDENMEARIIKDKKIERYIPVAFSHQEFYVVYQPKVDLTSGKVIGAEALVRWHSPELGNCMPDEFITLFERNGYINRLDFYVYKKVFEFLDGRAKAGKPIVPISVNMSRFHLADEKFVKKFWDLFTNYNIPPSMIEVEIVERSVGAGDNRLLEVTKQLHEKNFRVAIDDFGNGESSLNIISEIPADVLKLDQKFMRVDKDGKIPNEDEYKIVAKIVEMAKALGKETICEGVETEQQISFLRSVDVNYVQGFYYSRPLSEEDFVRYLEDHV